MKDVDIRKGYIINKVTDTGYIITKVTDTGYMEDEHSEDGIWYEKTSRQRKYSE